RSEPVARVCDDMSCPASNVWLGASRGPQRCTRTIRPNSSACGSHGEPSDSTAPTPQISSLRPWCPPVLAGGSSQTRLRVHQRIRDQQRVGRGSQLVGATTRPAYLLGGRTDQDYGERALARRFRDGCAPEGGEQAPSPQRPRKLWGRNTDDRTG